MIYHFFIFLNYFFSVVGGILADSFIGQYLTIAILSTVFAIGSILITVGSIELLHLPSEVMTFLGLFMIAVGSGGIKTCVSSFGADQFKLPEQELALQKYFSVFYVFTNIGSILSLTITPILKENIKCFGRLHCFPAGFGLSALLMIISVVVFVAGKPLYRDRPPSKYVLTKIIKCINVSLVTFN